MSSAQHKGLVSILFFGDLVGRPGREALQWYLSNLKDHEKPDVVIANVENATHGFGLSERHYEELLGAGVHIMTGGNHIWDRKDIFNWVESADRILRPSNFPDNNPGRGHGVFEIKGHTIGVINLIGQVFMGTYDSPWKLLEAHVAAIKEVTPVIFVDFHAEASAEKMAMGAYASQIGVSAFTGTHTHVQTADERILNHRMGYITDSGFCGAHDSVIGFFPEGSIQRLKTQIPTRMEVPDTSFVQINGTRYGIDPKTGICKTIERVNLIKDLNPAESFLSSDDSYSSHFYGS